MKDVMAMTPEEIKAAGHKVLVECLGVGAVRFMQQYDAEAANYIATHSDTAPVNTATLTDDELFQVGFDTLVEHLGLGGAIRFTQCYITGQGNYTEDRHQWLDRLAPGEFIAQARQVPRPK